MCLMFPRFVLVQPDCTFAFAMMLAHRFVTFMLQNA